THFFASGQTCEIGRGSNTYFPHCMNQSLSYTWAPVVLVSNPIAIVLTCGLFTESLEKHKSLSLSLTPSPRGRLRLSACPPRALVWPHQFSSQFSSPSSWSSPCHTPSSVERPLSSKQRFLTTCQSASWYETEPYSEHKMDLATLKSDCQRLPG